MNKKEYELAVYGANRGNVTSMCSLGRAYEEGVKGILEPDIEQAINWYSMCIDSGDEYSISVIAAIDRLKILRREGNESATKVLNAFNI